MRTNRGNMIEVRTSADFRQHIVTRALQANDDASGGYMLYGEFYDELLKEQAELSVMRQLCRVLPPLDPSRDEAAVPTMESALSDATWTSELANESADSTSPFGSRVLIPHALMKRVRVSRKLLRTQELAEMWIKEAIADALATPEEQAFLRGSGAGEPRGIITAAAAGDIDQVTSIAADSVTVDGLKEFVFSLPSRWHSRARIVTSAEFIGYLLMQKDASGDPLIENYNGRLFGIPVAYSDGFADCVDTTTSPTWSLNAGTSPAVIGDFGSGYWIQDLAMLDLQVLTELYAASNEVGYNATAYVDGAPVIQSAFTVLTVASS